jgi:predicted Zn-dependent peptidase
MKTAAIFAATLTGALGAHAAPPPAGGIPDRPEKIEFKPLDFQPPAAKDFRKTLKSGVPVYLAPSSEFPLVNIVFSFKGGAYLDPADKVGLADMTADMMRRGGTTTVKADDLNEKFDFLAAQANVFAGAQFMTASLNTLKSNLDESFGLFMDMLRNPGFQEDKIKVYLGEEIEAMKQRNDDAGAIMGREWPALVFGRDHFEARQTTQKSLESITSSDMRAFAQRVLQPGNLIIAINGDFDPAAMIALLDKAFEGWAKGEKMADPPAPTATITPGLYHIEKDIPQGKVNIGMRGLKRDDPDYFPVVIMNDVLGGGGFTSRITNRVRSDEGLAYRAGSRFSFPVWYPGVFGASFDSKNRTCALAAKIIFQEIEKMRNDKVTETELATAKKGLIETFPRQFESKPAMLGVFVNDEWTGRDPNFWRNFRDNVSKVTADDVQRVAKKYLTPENMAILVVGKWSEINPGDPTQQDANRKAAMTDFFAGKSTALPLRDPLTLEPLAN